METVGTSTELTQIITLPLGRVRKPWVPIRRQVVQFRRWLEASVRDVHGMVDLRLAKLIRSACTAFESAQRIRRTLAYGGEPGAKDGLDHATWLAYDSALQAREASADKALAALGLNRNKKDAAWDDILNAQRIAPDSDSSCSKPQTDPDSTEPNETRQEANASCAEGAP